MNDLIKREDVLKELQLDHKDVIYIDKTECARRIKAMPSADRPHGEWQYIAQGWHAIRRCSNCKWTQTYSDPKYLGYRYNYCPNCGAYMRGKDDE